VTCVKAVTAANLQHLRIWLYDHARENAPLHPEAVVLCAKLPMLIQKMIEPFGPGMKSPLQSELDKVRKGRNFSDDEIQGFHRRY
jgi:hypothetical protein